MTRLDRVDMIELVRLPAYRRLLLRLIEGAGVFSAGVGEARSFEFREGQKGLVLQLIGEAAETLPLARTNPEGARAAALIQILAEADQTAGKEIARGGPAGRYDDDDSGDGDAGGDAGR